MVQLAAATCRPPFQRCRFSMFDFAAALRCYGLLPAMAPAFRRCLRLRAAFALLIYFIMLMPFRLSLFLRAALRFVFSFAMLPPVRFVSPPPLLAFRCFDCHAAFALFASAIAILLFSASARLRHFVMLIAPATMVSPLFATIRCCH